MFGSLGDLAGLAKKARDLQENMKKAQSKIASLEASAKSSPQGVEALVSGELFVKQIKISPECLKSCDNDTLAAMVLSAVNAAMDEVKRQSKEEITKVTGGLNIPGLPGLFQ
jgi:DNA-binding YbaB/EbfC family protein